MHAIAESGLSKVFRSLREQRDSLLGVEPEHMKAAELGLAHSLSRFRIKFSPDKVDTVREWE